MAMDLLFPITDQNYKLWVYAYLVKVFHSQWLFFECLGYACLESGVKRNKKEALTSVERAEL